MSRYTAAHANPHGPGDSRPTALQIVQDSNMEGKLVGKAAVVTGVSSGLGIETVRALAATGATLYLTARNLDKARAALGDIFQPETMELVQMDHTSLSSVRQAAATILAKTNQVNLLIGNAGVMSVPDLQLTEDGYEVQFATNHLAHFLLFQLLKPALLAGGSPAFQSRVVMVASSGHRVHGLNESDNYHFQKGGYEAYVAYGQSKTANIYMASEIERRYGSCGLHATSLHPGVIATSLGRHMTEEQIQGLLHDETVLKVLKSPAQGAATTLWAAVGSEWEGKGGKYLADCAEAVQAEEDGHVGRTCVSYTYSPEEEGRLWRDSLQMVVIILEELNIPYTIKSFKFDDVKKSPFIDVNPNGRVPDPNTNLTLWESGAIIQYLIDVYDTTHQLSFPTLREKHLLNQYLQFQMSGQGPYYGQCGWFTTLSPEKLPSAITRYQSEVNRVLSVLNTLLRNKTWLVGEKCTYADLAFLPWNNRLEMLIPREDGGEILEAYPWVAGWQRRMEEREAWKRAMVVRERLMDEQGLQVNGMPKGVSNIKEYEELIARLEGEGERVDEEEGVLGCVGLGGGVKEGKVVSGDEERIDEEQGVLGCKETEEDERWDEDEGVLGCVGIGNTGGNNIKDRVMVGKKEMEHERWDEEEGALGCATMGRGY
ncbi:short-chain dehydrogenase/reductase [Aspergillus sclerotiicarbonarius CBS 121057]|uniref:Short-chain dehydrogenase/reductase n=1 Tax=Aspergillus sclerotiicarbonarius (strain CBS 121057 / IBT 28362) TaxID=1448318 RepID=A0A319F1Z4_ASPSB|nr:short-chain dehydrogenase/reductase [Aspergillus sclerotiicarbonarius CBS 121057]